MPATLLQTAGGKRAGEIYVMERVPQHAGHETALDMLNRAEGWFPFRPKGNGEGGGAGGVLLIAKGRTVFLTVHLTGPQDTAPVSCRKPARVAAAVAGARHLS